MYLNNTLSRKAFLYKHQFEFSFCPELKEPGQQVNYIKL